MEQLILVDKNDRELGFIEKEEAHKGDLPLHRAFSIFIFNSRGEMLIQKRSTEKKTFSGIWANACCSHPRKGEHLEDAIKRRLKEELGFVTQLRELFSFVYKARMGEWGEHELDHVFLGRYDGPVKPNKDEIEEWKFVSIDELKKDVRQNPDKYGAWFKLAYERVIEEVEK
jgi:isopentenyl-diphosphate delta-isomerase